MICPKCGKEINNGSNFCQFCGTNDLKRSSTTQVDPNVFKNALAANPADKPKKNKVLIIIAYIVGAILALIICIALFGDDDSENNTGGKSSGITIDADSVFETELGSISNIKFEKLEIGGINISGDFETSNYYSMTSDSYSYEIQFKVYDSDNKVLSTGNIYTPKVSVNEKCSFLGNAPLENADSADRIRFTGIKVFY